MKPTLRRLATAWPLVILLLLPALIRAETAVQAWVQRYNGPGNGYNGTSAVAVDGSNNVFVVGYSTGSGSSLDYATIKYSSAGVPLWTNRYNGPGNGSDYGEAVAVDGSNNVIVTGYSRGSGGYDDYATLKYSSGGVPLWTNRYHGPVSNNNNRASAVAVDSTNNVIVTGWSLTSGSYVDYATIKYSSAGVPIWTNYYNGPGNGSDRVFALALDRSNNVIVTGFSPGSGTSDDYATIKYSSAGVPLWTNRFNGPGNGDDWPKAVAVDRSNNVIVAGWSISTGSLDDYTTIKYSSAGVPIWTNYYNGPGNGSDRVFALALDRSNNVIVTGWSTNSGSSMGDCATIKYSGAGVPLWTNRYNGPGNGSDYGEAVAVDGSNNVIVTGFSLGSGTSYDYATIKYSSAGVPLWTNRYNGPGNGDDHAYALAVDGSNNVLVAGDSDSSGGNSDLTIVKYLVGSTPVLPPQPDLVAVEISPTSVRPGEPFTVTVSGANTGGDAGPDSALNASLLYSVGANDLVVTNWSAPWASNLFLILPGGQIYSQTCQANFATNHVVEASTGTNRWPAGQSSAMTFTVVPLRAGTIFVQARCTLRSWLDRTQCLFVNDAEAQGGAAATDQQGWPVARFSVSVTEPAGLTNLAITSGPSAIDENASADYVATAYYSDGSTAPVTAQASWSLTPAGLNGFVVTQGHLVTGEVLANLNLILQATFIQDGASRSATCPVTVRNVPKPGAIGGWVRQQDSTGRQQPLKQATVQLSGTATATKSTGEDGGFIFNNLPAGTYSLTASKDSYYSATHTSLVLNTEESRQDILTLMVKDQSGMPALFDFRAPDGRHFIAGKYSQASFDTMVAWNGTPGSVVFKWAGTSQSAQLEDLGNGLARAKANAFPLPLSVPATDELVIEVVNGNNQEITKPTGVYLYHLPDIVKEWYDSDSNWRLLSGATLTYDRSVDFTLWPEKKLGELTLSASIGYAESLSYDAGTGVFTGSHEGHGTFNLSAELPSFELIQESSLGLNASLSLALAGKHPTQPTLAWGVASSGKVGAGIPVVNAAKLLPPLAPIVQGLQSFKPTRHVVNSIQLRIFIIGGEGMSATYGPTPGICFRGAQDLALSGTLGAEAQLALELSDVEAKVYVGATGTPQLSVCPEWTFDGLTLRGYAGASISAWIFEASVERGVEFTFGGQPSPAMFSKTMPPEQAPLLWMPLGTASRQWGDPNRIPSSIRPGGGPKGGPPPGMASVETIAQNVIGIAHPSLLARTNQTLILFTLLNTNKPTYAPTDIGVLHQTNGGSWLLSKATDDLKADSASAVADAGNGLALAAWEHLDGDVSGATDPLQVLPHLEIVAAWRNLSSTAWTQPQQLTTNNLVDRDPRPVVFGATQGILWVQNEAQDSLGNSTNGDRLVFAKWTGNTWNSPQVLWAGPKGVLGTSFTADTNGEGHIVFAVDQDGIPDTREDRELYRLSTIGSVWQGAERLTTNSFEDTMPVLFSPTGIPMCVWSASNLLQYSSLTIWSPRSLFSQYTLANQAPTLAGANLPGGRAAVAYAVQGTNGTDIFASVYDALVDGWALPRRLTGDEDAESGISLACDGTNLVAAYLKTQTVRTNKTVQINGQTYQIPNVPTPGRVDLCLLRHTLGYDLALVPSSLKFEPDNAVPGSNTAVIATIQNSGDLPVQGVQIFFYDGDPAQSGTLIGSQQLNGILLGGETRTVTNIWSVPPTANTHQIFVVVNALPAVEDRDSSNNTLIRTTALPDLLITTGRNEELSQSAVLLIARVTNAGATPAGTNTMSWRLGAPNGPEIGRNPIPLLAPGQTQEITFAWDTTQVAFQQPFATVFAVVDADNAVTEFDESNNASGQTVRVIPGWIPRILALKVFDSPTALLTFTAPSSKAADLLLDSTASLSNSLPWTVESSAAITATVFGEFQAEVPLRGPCRFYRVRTTAVAPASPPGLLGIKLIGSPHATLTFEAGGLPLSALSVESTAFLGTTNLWVSETNAVLTTTSPGTFEAHVPLRKNVSFYRIRSAQ